MFQVLGCNDIRIRGTHVGLFKCWMQFQFFCRGHCFIPFANQISSLVSPPRYTNRYQQTKYWVNSVELSHTSRPGRVWQGCGLEIYFYLVLTRSTQGYQWIVSLYTGHGWLIFSRYQYVDWWSKQMTRLKTIFIWGFLSYYTNSSEVTWEEVFRKQQVYFDVRCLLLCIRGLTPPALILEQVRTEIKRTVMRLRKRTSSRLKTGTGCKVPIFPIFFYFWEAFLFSPIFLRKRPIFPIFWFMVQRMETSFLGIHRLWLRRNNHCWSESSERGSKISRSLTFAAKKCTYN